MFQKIHFFSPHITYLITIKLTRRIKRVGKVQQQLCYYKDKLNMKKKSGRRVTQQNNCSAASVYNSIFGFSVNVWLKYKDITHNMILCLTDLGKKWDWCDADLPQHSPDRNELTYLQPLQKSGNLSKEHASFFPKLLKPQSVSPHFFIFLPTISSKTRPIFFLLSLFIALQTQGEPSEDIINSVIHSD